MYYTGNTIDYIIAYAFAGHSINDGHGDLANTVMPSGRCGHRLGPGVLDTSNI